MQTQNIELDIKGDIIRGVIENPGSKKLIIFVPGFTGNAKGPDDIFIQLSQELQNDNYSILRFDFRGTAPSDGNFQDMTVERETQDLREVIGYANSLGYSEVALLGESMGGTIALEAYHSNIKLMIFWYSAFNFFDTDFRSLLTNEIQEELQDRGYTICENFKVGKEFINQIPEIDIYKKIENITCPTFLLHGDKDIDVPVEQSKKAFELLKSQKEIHILKGADHCFRNEQDEAISLTYNFIKSYF